MEDARERRAKGKRAESEGHARRLGKRTRARGGGVKEQGELEEGECTFVKNYCPTFSICCRFLSQLRGSEFTRIETEGLCVHVPMLREGELVLNLQHDHVQCRMLDQESNVNIRIAY